MRLDFTIVEDLKKLAGRSAAEMVRDGMRLGLGTGSTVEPFLEALGRRLGDGRLRDVVGVATSVRTERTASALRIPLVGLDEVGSLDLAVDGADEVDPGLDLIKGLGGALLREKMVAQASRRFVVVADESKCVKRLGERVPVPVEVVPFGFRGHLGWLRDLGADPVVRLGADGAPYRTDNGNLIVDCRFAGGVENAAELERRLAGRAGVVESGLFLGMATHAVVAGREGVRRLVREGAC